MTDEQRWFLELPEEDGSACMLGAPCRLWDRSTEPWTLVAEGALLDCQEALDALLAPGWGSDA